jgi:hypothetical protein
LQLPPDVTIDVYGLPGDTPSDVSTVLSTITRLMDEVRVHWCVVGDILLAHYGVPKITGVRVIIIILFWRRADNITEQDIEICVLSEDLHLVQEALTAATEFCFPFRPGRSHYNRHLSQYSRFRVKDMNQCFFLVPAPHYGLHPGAFVDIMQLPDLAFPLLPLPHYIKGLANIVVSHGTDNNNFLTQITFLIDGVDIGEEWCNMYLDGPSLEFVRSISTRSAKKDRMGSHPKYEGNLTTYIHDESEREVAVNIVGRVMEGKR